MKSSIIKSIISLATLSMLHAQDVGNPFVLNGKSNFLAQPTGTLSHLPNASSQRAAEASYRNVILKTQKSYRIRGNRTQYFRINHRGDGEPKPTYLGIQIIRFFDQWHSATDPIYLFRNDNWFSGDRHISAMRRTSSMSLGRFSEFHTLQEKPESLHNIIAAKWHAAVDLSGDPHSWDKKENWNLISLLDQALLQRTFGRNLPEDYEVTADCGLIRFTQSPAPRTTGVHFNFNPGGAKAVILRTFAPDTRAYDNIVYLVIQ